MPRVPTVDGPSAEAAPLPGARYVASPAAGAGALQQAGRLNEVAQGFTEWARQKTQQDDIDAAWRAETALKDSYLQFEQDEFGKQGVNAAGATQRAQQWWQENTQKFGEGLTARQQSAYLRNVTALRQSSADALMRHERQQGSVAIAESAQARVGSAISMAVQDPTPERLANSRREITEAVNISGSLTGMPEDAKAAKLQDMLSLMHRGVVLQLADTDPDAAKAYYYGNKKEMTGATALELEKVVERSGRLQKTQSAADDIMARGLSLPDAMTYIEKTYSGEDEKSIKDEVHSRWATKKQGEAEIVSQAYGRALLAVEQGRHVPAEAWSLMDDTHRAAIEERRRAEAKRAEAEARGRDIRTDFQTWDGLNRMVTSDPHGFALVDLNRYADKVSRSDLMEFANIQRKLRAGDEKPVKDATTLGQQIDVVSDSMKLKPNSPESAALRKAINDAINTEQQTRGKELSYEERQKVIDQQVMQMVVPGRFFGTNEKPAYQLTPEERATARAKVPDADRALIVEALRKRGKPITEEAISELYLLGKAQR
jgi:hypothetical protein